MQARDRDLGMHSMSVIDTWMLHLKRGDSAPARAVRDIYRWLMRWNLPRGRAIDAAYAALYRAHDLYEDAREFTLAKLLYEPMVRARFAQVGERVHISALPYVRGHARIVIGDDCRLGKFSADSGRFCNDPVLEFGNGVTLGSGSVFVVNERISIGDRVGIASRCWISDSDGHPADPERRFAGADLSGTDIRPITVEDHAWIGHGAKLLKGVRVGRGAVVAAGSVVTSDVPPGALAMGVPARMLKTPW